MIHHKEISKEELHQKIRQKEICFGGNKKLKIYGTLHCQSGKRMKKENRIFFISVKEALQLGYRPCGHCMKANYQTWKNTQPNFKNKLKTYNLQKWICLIPNRYPTYCLRMVLQFITESY